MYYKAKRVSERSVLLVLQSADAADDLGVGELVLQLAEELVLLRRQRCDHADGARHAGVEQRLVGGVGVLGEAHDERAVAEAVDKVARVVLAHGEQAQALLVGGRLRVAPDDVEIEVLLGADEGVVVDDLHGRDPVGIVVPRDLLDRVVRGLEHVQVDALHQVAHRDEVAPHGRVQRDDVRLRLRQRLKLLAASLGVAEAEEAQL